MATSQSCRSTHLRITTVVAAWVAGSWDGGRGRFVSRRFIKGGLADYSIEVVIGIGKAGRTRAFLIVSVRVFNRRRDAIARVSFAVVLFTTLRQARDFPSTHTPLFIFRVSA